MEDGTMAIIKIEKLHKACDKNIAVNNVSFEVQKGEIFDMVA